MEKIDGFEEEQKEEDIEGSAHVSSNILTGKNDSKHSSDNVSNEMQMDAAFVEGEDISEEEEDMSVALGK